MTDTVSVFNQALSWLGAKRITSWMDDSNEAQLGRDNFDMIRDAVLEDHAWRFADKRLILSAPLTDDWGANLFALPVEVIRAYRCFTAANGRNFERLEWQRQGEYISTVGTVDTVYCQATVRIENPDKWTPAFTQAFAARLAADLAIPITKSRQLQADLWSIYQAKLAAASATDASQGTSERTDSVELTNIRWR